jgi:hypothetical protein
VVKQIEAFDTQKHQIFGFAIVAAAALIALAVKDTKADPVAQTAILLLTQVLLGLATRWIIAKDKAGVEWRVYLREVVEPDLPGIRVEHARSLQTAFAC